VDISIFSKILRSGELSDYTLEKGHFFNYEKLNDLIKKHCLPVVYEKPVKVIKHTLKTYKHTDEDKLIYKIRRDWFLKNNRIDIISLFVFGKFKQSNTVHHSAGRGKNLNNLDSFIATTPEGDKWAHANRKLAKEIGFII